MYRNIPYNFKSIGSLLRVALLVFLMALFFMFGTISAYAAAPSTVSNIQNWQRGASIYSVHQDDFAGDLFKQTLKDMKADGFNYVSLVIPYHQASRNASDVHPGGDTPTDQDLVSAIQYAHSIGLAVMLKPHLAPDDTDWRAYVNATNRDAWFGSYGRMLNHLGDIAAVNGAEEICIGTELISMTSTTTNSSNTQGWIDMIKNLRTHYSGLLTYSANWGGSDFTDEVSHIEFWPYLDFIGISAYYPIAGNTWQPTTEALLGTWKYWDEKSISKLATKYNKKVLFTEVGYRSIDGANSDPWDGSREAGLNFDIQTKLFDALMRYWSDKSYMAGIQIWNWEVDPNDGGAGNSHYTVQYKPAEDVLSSWFTTQKSPRVMMSFGRNLNASTIVNGLQEIGTSTELYAPKISSGESKLETFKASISTRPVYTYVTYWQVDGGKQIEMHDAVDGSAYKTADVDVSKWTWDGKGPYLVTFVSKEFSGKIIAQKSIQIYVE